jgi:hypothetical protein
MDDMPSFVMLNVIMLSVIVPNVIYPECPNLAHYAKLRYVITID